MRGKIIHGLSRTPLYRVWEGIVARCCSPSLPSYKYYGGRGITVCDEWRHDPEAFCKWGLSNGYKKGLQIDRIDNNKGYSPDNCRFVTRRENLLNTSMNRRLVFNGESKTLSEWSERLGISVCCLIKRKNRGWSDEKTLSTPINPNYHRFSHPEIISCRGEKHTCREWAAITGMHPSTIHHRVRAGWPPERALETPVRQKCRSVVAK